jgi:hypothetical protein
MDRHIIWSAWEGPGLEHLHLTQQEATVTADSLIICVIDERPIRLRYTITCDDRWRMRSVDLVSLEDEQQAIRLRTDGEGQWTNAAGQLVPDLDGCREVDISLTPFTNTLPIRRLVLAPGQTQDVPAAYIDVARFTVQRVPQRYTRLQTSGQVYLYEGLLWDFRAELPVDADGLVLDYPGLFRRVWAG